MIKLDEFEKKLIEYITEGYKHGLKKEDLRSQVTFASFENLLHVMFNDANIEGYGIKLIRDESNGFSIIVTKESKIEYNSSDWEKYVYINYFLSRIINFLEYLKTNNYVEFVLMHNFKNDFKSTKIDQCIFSFGSCECELINGRLLDQTLVNKIITLFDFYILPTKELRDFKENDFKTISDIQFEKVFLLTHRNVKIAQITLWISMLAMLISLLGLLFSNFF